VLDLLTTALGSKQSMIQVDSSILNVSINIGLMIVAVTLSACASTDSRDDVAAGRADGGPDNRALVDCTDVSPACDAGGDCP